MSNIVSGLCYKAKFGCPKRKAIAVAMGDHAHDDGSNVYPSVRRLALKVEWSERTVQRVLRELEAIGLLEVVSNGGGGPKDTREWNFNMDVLRDLADGHVVISDNEGDSESPLEGDSESPITLLRVTETPLRVTGSTPKGDSAVTRTINNHHKPSGASARASDKGTRSAPALEDESITLTPETHSVEFAAWLDHWIETGDRPKANLCRKYGTMIVPTTMPPERRDAVPQRGKMFAAGDA